MALERTDIVKKDFPVERRGYAPETVDSHLEQVAAEVEALRRAAEGKSGGLASAASARVQAIVDAAESTAADIDREAQADAHRIREEASAEAAERVGEVRDAASDLLGRIEALQGEIASMFEDMREGASRVAATLETLDGDVASLRAKAPRPLSTPVAAAVPEATVDEVAPEEVAEPVEAEAGGDDAQNARLVALNMALNGASRKETQRYLSENFRIEDPDQLLDDVYAQRGL